MKKKFLIFFFICFLFLASLPFWLTKGVHQPESSSDLQKDDQNNKVENDKDDQNNKVENDKKDTRAPSKELKSDKPFGNFYYFEIFIFFLAPVIDLVVLKVKGVEKENFCWSFIFFYFIFSFVIAEFINHLGASLYEYRRSEGSSFLTILKRSLKRRLSLITLVFLFVQLVFTVILCWSGYVCSFDS